ncbi:MAG: nucleotidyltransferase [SAR324 cluster bacterium]|uniref:Nucleotidyltransferase n=1 Tax=SAR324 cluster bacterium TaxID=2024889 RepID=A0A2A4SYS3_9DELT|nr:MAG: nucleotidyltransferase [SAR324 cluster bacterium]
MIEDARWQQCFSNYRKALSTLNDAVDLSQQRPLSSLETLGVVHVFEYTHELAWNCLKNFLQHQGQQDIDDSRNATRKAFEVELIENGEQWMGMIANRNRSSRAYNQETAEAIVKAVIEQYQPLFMQLQNKFNSLLKGSFLESSRIF